MILKSFGCSFIYGTDLSDVSPQTASKNTWPALLAERFGLSYKCLANGGQGNLAILDRLSQAICQDANDLYVIQWTYIDRFDYSDPKGYHFDQAIVNDWHTVRPGDQNPQSDFYFRWLHSEYRDKLTSVVYVKAAQDLLNKHGCCYIMTCMDPLLICNRWHTNTVMQSWQRDIAADLNWFAGKDFCSWSQHQNFAVGPTGHPLEEAHAAAADYMMPIIDTILHKA